MSRATFFTLVLIGLLFSCQTQTNRVPKAKVQIASAMKNVMWKGELAGTIQMDSLAEMGDTYGLGPLEFLQGELLLFNGQAFVSKVETDTTMRVYQDEQAKAPFFVYSQVSKWSEIVLPDSIGNISQLEAFLNHQTQDHDQPFAFKLAGSVKSAEIHIQNLPAGAQVSSPKEAHQGQVNYHLGPKKVDLLGFFSRKHQGIFTHHDTYVHLHLLTADRKQMGHLDAVDFASADMELYLPEGLIE